MRTTFFTHAAMSALLLATSAVVAAAQTAGSFASPSSEGSFNQQLELTHAQRSAILQAVGGDKSKTANVQFPTAVGAEVPPSINLYALPEEAVNNNSAAKLYQFTVVQGDVVIVDPTKMRIVDVIRKLSK